jgi:hypothetical protein
MSYRGLVILRPWAVAFSWSACGMDLPLAGLNVGWDGRGLPGHRLGSSVLRLGWDRQGWTCSMLAINWARLTIPWSGHELDIGWAGFAVVLSWLSMR